MKIDKSNPGHWISLAFFGMNVVLARFLRVFRGVKDSGHVVVLYGHRLNGNLRALYHYWERHANKEMEMSFLTMDKNYHATLRSAGIASVLATRPAAIRLMASADAIVSDHGLHVMHVLMGSRRLNFIDVWHGIPFKGFDEDDFKIQRRYDQAWVASDLCRKLYVERFGFHPSKVYATGYARTDRLAARDAEDSNARTSLGIPAGRKTILFAPTWAQDNKGRSIFPFGCGEREFMAALCGVAHAHEAVVLMRSHLNTGVLKAFENANVISLPATKFPDTEAILLASDILICDWSSIAFDFMLLKRPTIFLDVPPPFRKGFSLGPEYRFGAITGSLEAMIEALHIYLKDADAYWESHAERHLALISEIYGATADGQSSARCFAQLRECLAKI